MANTLGKDVTKRPHEVHSSSKSPAKRPSASNSFRKPSPKLDPSTDHSFPFQPSPRNAATEYPSPVSEYSVHVQSPSVSPKTSLAPSRSPSRPPQSSSCPSSSQQALSRLSSSCLSSTPSTRPANPTALAQESIQAAYASRLDPFALHPKEIPLLRSQACQRTATAYLNVRNRILRLWLANPLLSVTAEEAVRCAMADQWISLSLRAYDWLVRQGYINFGCLNQAKPFAKRPEHTSGSAKTVIVVGAGMAGIGCARQLTNLFQHYRLPDPPRVILLEGRNRIGGRIYSHPVANLPVSHLPQSRATAEMGAHIILGFEQGNPLDVIVHKQLALRHHSLTDASNLHDCDGRLVPIEKDRAAEALFNQVLDQASNFRYPSHHPSVLHGDRAMIEAGQDPEFSSSGTFHAPTRPAVACSKEDLGSFLDTSISQVPHLTPQDRRLINWHYANLEYANASTVSDLSLGGWDQDSGNECAGPHAQVVGGYQQVPLALLSIPTPLDLRTRAVVQAVAYDPTAKSAAKVLLEDGTTLEADHVVLTVPLGVLKHHGIVLNPPLPSAKTHSIHALGFGVLNKCVLVYDTPFWDVDQDMIGLLQEPDQPQSVEQRDYAKNRGRCYLFWNCVKTSNAPVLIALLAGEAALLAGTMSDAEIVREATKQLQKIYGSAALAPKETIVTRWQNDPFSQGSYSYMGREARAEDYDVMAQSVGNLHFAGEATCGTHPATVHGAYLSGLRAAADLMEALDVTPCTTLPGESGFRQQSTPSSSVSLTKSLSRSSPTSDESPPRPIEPVQQVQSLNVILQIRPSLL